MLRRHLINHIDIPRDRFHWINTEAADLDSVCREYDAAIGTGFDLTLLGIGLNGHLGLNEPGSQLDSTTRRVEMHASTIQASAGYLTHTRLPTWGVGVGLKQLLASKEIWLIANGTMKAQIVQRLLSEPISKDLPASLVRQHPHAYLLVDAQAGAGICPVEKG
jgi:glucosamine-6-phosphate deaminase